MRRVFQWNDSPPSLRARAGISAPAPNRKTFAAHVAKKILAGLALALLLAAGAWQAVVLSRQQAAIVTVATRISQLDAEAGRIRQERNAAVGQLRTTEQEIARLVAIPDVELDAEVAGWLERVATLHEIAAQQPERTLPEFSLLTEKDWFNAARDATFITNDELRGLVALLTLRNTARMRLGPRLREALIRFVDAHEGQLPDDVPQLEPYTTPPVSPTILARYEMTQHGNLVDLPPADWLIDEKTSFDESADNRLYITRARLGTTYFSEMRPQDLRGALQAFLSTNAGQFPTTPAQLLPFFSRNPSPVALKTFLEKPAADFAPEELQKILSAD